MRIWFCSKLRFVIEKFLMKFIEGDWTLSRLNGIGELLVIIVKTIENIHDEILRINREG